MGRERAIADLKKQLLVEVRRFCRRDDLVWKKPIVDTLLDLQKAHVQAVFFGGTLRSLLSARVFERRPGRPRDVDIVVSGASIDSLKEYFEKIISRETRFGGLQLRRREWQFDVWPLGQTWAFVQDAGAVPSFSALPSTTFFNLEAIAVDVWPSPGRPRHLYSGDDQFFDGILSRTLEINREVNPFPELCVLRALIMSADLDIQIGPRLAHYISRHGELLTADVLEDLQRNHYGKQRAGGQTLRRWIEFVAAAHTQEPSLPISLPVSRQLRLWADPVDISHVRLHAISASVVRS